MKITLKKIETYVRSFTLYMEKNNNNEKNRNYDDSMNNIGKSKIDNVNNTNNVSTFENHASVVIGPQNVGKTYYMLKVLEKVGNKGPIHIITRSPNQCPYYKTSTEIKPKNKNKGSIVIFDDMLGARNSSQLDEVFTGGRHEFLGVYYISQRYFA